MYIQIVVDGHNEHAREFIFRLEGMGIPYMHKSVCSDIMHWHNVHTRERMLRLGRIGLTVYVQILWMGMMCMQDSVYTD